MAQLGISRVAGLSSSVAKMVKGYRHVDATEARLVANMAKEGIAWRTIQKIIVSRRPCVFLRGSEDVLTDSLEHAISHVCVKKGVPHVRIITFIQIC